MKKKSLAATAAVALGLVTWLWMGGRSGPPRAASGPPRVPVVVETVGRRDVPQLARGIGSVQSLHHVVLRAQVEGVLSEVLFKEGQTVRRGQLLARIDDRAIAAELAAARAEKARNEATRRAARADFLRYESLVKEGAIPRQTFDQQKATLAEVEAAMRGNDAAIRAAEVKLSYTRIMAPVNGRVGLRRIDPGNLVGPGNADGLVAVSQVDPIAVVFSLPQDQLARVDQLLADTAAAQVVAYDRDAGTRLADGRLTVADNQIDSTTGTLSLKAEFANSGGKLLPGQFVVVELTTGVSLDATVVSARAVQRGRDGTFVFRVEDGAARVVPVKVAWQDDRLAVISSGIAPGEIVVIDGHSRLKPGSPVNVVARPEAQTQTLAGGVP